MSQTDNTTADLAADLVQPAAKTTAATPSGDLEWTYSGKAMRAQCILYWIITTILVGAAVYATVIAGGNNFFAAIWIAEIVLNFLLWGHFFVVYFYRTLTIRYKMTDRRLYTYRGLFTRTSDSMELMFIDDIQLTQTLWDRVLNGGVGTILIRSPADQSHPELKITGVDGPQKIFTRIDEIRTELRRRRAILSSGNYDDGGELVANDL